MISMYASAMCKQHSSVPSRSDQLTAVTNVWYLPAGANPFFWWIGHGGMVSMLATAMGGERCLWDSQALDTKPHPTKWSNSLIIGIYITFYKTCSQDSSIQDIIIIIPTFIDYHPLFPAGSPIKDTKTQWNECNCTEVRWHECHGVWNQRCLTVCSTVYSD